ERAERQSTEDLLNVWHALLATAQNVLAKLPYWPVAVLPRRLCGRRGRCGQLPDDRACTRKRVVPIDERGDLHHGSIASDVAGLHQWEKDMNQLHSFVKSIALTTGVALSLAVSAQSYAQNTPAPQPSPEALQA